MLDSGEAARRLGVKLTTLYAYVSRGLLESHPAPGGRRSLFDGDDVEQLARRSRQGKAVESRMATITTGITQLTDDWPLYRGRRATDLATQSRFEEVAELLWDAPDDGPGDRDWLPVAVGEPPGLRSSDRMRWAAVMAGALDPLRADLRPEAVARTARRLTATMVEALPGPAERTADAAHPVPAGGRGGTGSIAERLAAKLSPVPTEDLVRGVNAALVLMADHELATSTMAVRLAASTRADPYDAVLAGLGTIAGPLHGGASQLAYSLLVDARRLGVERALNDTLRWQGLPPGFGHTVYKDGDPRCTVLLGLFDGVARPEDAELVRSLLDLAADHTIPPPNVDLGLAAMAWATGMSPDAGQVLFTVARVAGWVAHYLEELEERPLRFRARAIYAASHRD
jgi:citrate synthase